MSLEIDGQTYESRAIRHRKQKKKPMEFSKKILVVSWVSGSAVVIFALWLTFKMVIGGYSGDTSLVAIILSGGFAEITAGTGFYYHKSRKENEIKLKSVYGNSTELLESDSVSF